MVHEVLRIGTRGSDLALWQARWVEQQLGVIHPFLAITTVIIKTKGDKILDSPLSKIGDKGLFTREIENALLEDEVDLAIHSLKDLPTALPAGLRIGAISLREDVRDVFLPHPSNPARTLGQQAKGARIATGSLRRKCQLLNFRPDFSVVDIRGNLRTRINKLDESDWAGMILAKAGVLRLGWESRIGETIPIEMMLPAVGQGALGVEIRDGDTRVADLVAPLNHRETELTTSAERSLLRTLEGGCQVPIGTFSRILKNKLVLTALVGELDGSAIVRGEREGTPDAAVEIGKELAEELLRRGADRILKSIRSGGQQVDS